jgi:hypothetical protein
MTTPLIITCPVRPACRQPKGADSAPGRIPRLTRLLALAIKFDKLIRAGTIRNYADLARLGHVSRARISQIMKLLLLAADIQEEILFLPQTRNGRDAINLLQVQTIALVPSWQKQRRLWRGLKKQAYPSWST